MHKMGKKRKNAKKFFNYYQFHWKGNVLAKPPKVGRRTIGLSGAQFESHQASVLEQVMP